MTFFKLSAILLFLISVNSFSEENRIKNNIPENLRALLETSLRSPSSHNAQMWKIKYSSPGIIEILLDKQRVLTEVDPDNREAYISIGALCESILSAAEEYSLKAVIEDSIDESVLLRIRFENSISKVNNRFSNLIKKRCTVRGKYEKNEIDKKDINYLCSSFPGMIEYYPRESKTGSAIAHLTKTASETQTENDSKQQELSNWFRFSKKESRDKKDGITPEMMGFKGLMKDIIYFLFNERTAMKRSFKKSTAAVTEKQVDNCGGFFIIRSENNERESLLETGRILQRLWLRAVERDIAFHPMSQALEENDPKTALYRIIGKSDEIQMIIRAGYLKKYPEPKSRRRSLEEVLIY